MPEQTDANPQYPSTRPANESHEDEIDLARLFPALWKKKWWIIGGSIASALVALIIALLLTATYTGSGTLIIKQGQSSPLSNFVSGSGLAGALLGNAGGGNIRNEIAIMESRSLAERITDSLMAEPIMENGRMYPVLWAEWPADSVLAEQRTIIGRLMEQLEYTLNDQTTIVKVVTESPSPYEAMVLSNLAMQTYQALSLEQSQDMTGTTAEYLAEEQAQIKDSLAQAERALRDYMENNEVVGLEIQTEQQIQQYAQMTGKRFEAEAQLEAANAAIDEYQQRLNSIKPGLAEKLANAIGSTIQNLQFQISELETKRALIYSRNPRLEDNETVPPEIARINEQIQKLQQRVINQTESILQTNDEYLGLLAENSASVINTITEYTQKLIGLRIERLQFRARIEALNEQIAQKEQFFNTVPENTLQMARLKRQVEVLQEIYLLITKQLAQTQFQAKSEMANSRILDEAILPRSPSFPNYWLFLAVGLFLGGIVSVGYVSIRAFIDDTVYNAHFLKQYGYRVIEIEGAQDSRGLGLFAEFLISQSEQFNQKAHALLPADATRKNIKPLLTKLIATINAKAYRATGIDAGGSNAKIIGQADNIIEPDSVEREKELGPMVARQAEEADIVIIAGGSLTGDVQDSLSIARLSDSSWIIAEAGFTTLSSIKMLEDHIKAVQSDLEGIILLH